MEELNKLLEQRAQRNLEKLDNLPQSPGGTIRELMEYDFMDPDAQQMFQELLDTLRGQMAGSISQDMIEQLRNMTPEQMSAMREMLHQLNQMLRDRLTGQTRTLRDSCSSSARCSGKTRRTAWTSCWSK